MVLQGDGGFPLGGLEDSVSKFKVCCDLLCVAFDGINIVYCVTFSVFYTTMASLEVIHMLDPYHPSCFDTVTIIDQLLNKIIINEF